MGATFVKQKIEAAADVGRRWSKKTAQYVLALPEQDVFQVV